MYLSLERRGLRGTQAEGTASSQRLAEGHLGSGVSGFKLTAYLVLKYTPQLQIFNTVRPYASSLRGRESEW